MLIFNVMAEARSMTIVRKVVESGAEKKLPIQARVC